MSWIMVWRQAVCAFRRHDEDTELIPFHGMDARYCKRCWRYW